jgi:polyphosphate kinase 2 (PPK2 family)
MYCSTRAPEDLLGAVAVMSIEIDNRRACAPWFVIPANHKWFRNLAVSQIIADTAAASLW